METTLMADTELHETDSEDQKDWQAETDADVKDTDTNETDEADDDTASPWTRCRRCSTPPPTSQR